MSLHTVISDRLTGLAISLQLFPLSPRCCGDCRRASRQLQSQSPSSRAGWKTGWGKDVDGLWVDGKMSLEWFSQHITSQLLQQAPIFSVRCVSWLSSFCISVFQTLTIREEEKLDAEWKVQQAGCFDISFDMPPAEKGPCTGMERYSMPGVIPIFCIVDQ